MKSTNPNITYIKAISSISILLCVSALSGCQSTATTSSSSEQTDRPRLAQQTTAEEVVPLLKTTMGGKSSEFKLRSQTSHFLNADKSSAEIILSNTVTANCQKQTPVLQENDQQIKISIKSKDGKTAIGKGELANNQNYDLSISLFTKKGENKLDAKLINSLKISDLNNAIIRGNLKTSQSSDNQTPSWDGEFFTAICR